MAALVLVGATAKADPLPGFVLTAQTAHFSFYSRSKERVDAEKAERYVMEVGRLLGQPVSGRAEYYRYGSPEEVAALTGTYASGVTFAQAGQIHSAQEFHAHEIVHLVAGKLGNSGTFFQEGLAVALGNEARWRGKDVHKLAKGAAKNARLSVLAASFDRLDPETAYPIAGSFVAYVIKAHGVSKVADFFRACGTAGTDRDAAFQRTFGRTLDEAGSAWMASL